MKSVVYTHTQIFLELWIGHSARDADGKILVTHTDFYLQITLKEDTCNAVYLLMFLILLFIDHLSAECPCINSGSNKLEGDHHHTATQIGRAHV